jgi:hypothetical protein
MYYVLTGEYGEYEQFDRVVLGVFSSEKEAADAIPKFRELGARQWAAYKDYERRKSEYLERFEPAMVYPVSAPDNDSPFPSGYTGYKNEQYEEAEAAVGPVPKLVPTCDKYEILPFNLDAVEAR